MAADALRGRWKDTQDAQDAQDAVSMFLPSSSAAALYVLRTPYAVLTNQYSCAYRYGRSLRSTYPCYSTEYTLVGPPEE